MPHSDSQDPIEQEKQEMLGQKLSDGYQGGYAAEQAAIARDWDRQREWDRRECGAGGWDEDCEND